MKMKKLLLTLMLAVVSSSVMAEWIYVGNNAYELGDKYVVHTAYANPASIQKVGNITKIRIFIDKRQVKKINYKKKSLPKPQAEIAGWHVEFECKQKQSRWRDNGWILVSPDSIDDKLWKYACGK